MGRELIRDILVYLQPIKIKRISEIRSTQQAAGEVKAGLTPPHPLPILNTNLDVLLSFFLLLSLLLSFICLF